MFKCTFKLEQHTPIIHFQPDQSGATLRASELKPKFDKFLLEKIPDLPHKINNKSKYLDYKVKIIDTDTNPTIYNDLSSFKSFFGNLGTEHNNIKKGILSNKVIDIKFIILNNNEKLKNAIDKWFPLFLILNNFGTRQNKGFGSFYLKDNNKDISNLLIENDIKFGHGKYNDEISINILKHIYIIYLLMKSGINYPDHPKVDNRPDMTRKGTKQTYYKSFLYEYMLGRNIGNEKRFIKENYFDSHVRILNDGITKKYVKALLGTTQLIKFRDLERNGKVEYKSTDIERFKSPILFKIIKDELFIFPENINQNIFDKTFVFKQKHNTYDINKNIQTPLSSEFDLNEFLKQFIEHFNSLTLKTDTRLMNYLDNELNNAKRITLSFQGGTP